jgi:hypothetical protein
MTEPVILDRCDTCERRTPHTRDQQGKADPPRVVTERICSKCGTTTTHIKRISGGSLKR